MMTLKRKVTSLSLTSESGAIVLLGRLLVICMFISITTISVSAQTIIVTTFGEGTYCEGENVVLRALPGGGQNQSYRWTLLDGSEVNGPMLDLGLVTPQDAGDYVLYIYLTANPSVNDTRTLTVDVVPLPRISLDTETYLCDNEQYISDAVVDFSDDMVWTSTGDGIFTQPNMSQAGYILGPADLQAAMVTLTLTADSYNGGMCDPAVAQIVINIREAPDLQFVLTRESDCDDRNGSIAVVMQDWPAGFEYSINNGLNWQASSKFEGLPSGTYNIIAADNFGCRAIYADNPFTLNQIQNCDDEVIFPTAFAPLSSNLANSSFYPIWVNSVPAEYTMQIFNKWGELVFETRNPYAGWNGVSNNELLPAETYVYVVRVRFIAESSSGNGFKVQRGNVRLIR
jgi:gliding motility-associated-like protein